MNVELARVDSSSNGSLATPPRIVICEAPGQEEIPTEIFDSPSISDRSALHRSSFFNPVRLKSVGKKDIAVGFLLIVLAVLQSGIYWSFTLGNEQRTLPSNTYLNASSTFEAELQVNGTFYCSSNATLPSISSENNNSILNTPKGYTFYEIAKCLGWTNEHFFITIAKDIVSMFRYTLTMITFAWAITNINEFKGKDQTMKLITVWLVAICVYALAYVVSNMMKSMFVLIAMNVIGFSLCLTKIKGFLSIKFRLRPKWFLVWILGMVLLAFTALIPVWFGSSVTQILQVLLPLILSGFDIFLCYAITQCFNEYRYNKRGQAIMILTYIWHMELTRFDCFISLFLQWLSKKVPFRDVFLNSLFSVLGEIWTHTGIREALGNKLERRWGFKGLKSNFPQIRNSYGSIRNILEWVIPTVGCSTLCFIELRRDYIMVPEDEINTQVYFFTSARVFQNIIPIMIGYYSVEVISVIICSAIKNVTGYKEKSVIGTLGWYSILRLGFGVVLLDDCRFVSRLWTAFSDLN